MKMSKYNYSTITVTVIAVLAGLILPISVSAQGLSVDFEDEPLFSMDNFLPGDVISKTVEVNNNSDTDQTIGVSANSVNNADNLGDVISLSIQENQSASAEYENTFSEFFADGEVELSSLPAGAGTTYTFTAAFDDAAGNNYQTKTLGFDLCVGFVGGEISCGDTQSQTTSNAASVGGSGPPPASITVSNDETRNESPTEPDGDVAGVATSTDTVDPLSDLLTDLEGALKDLLSSTQPSSPEQNKSRVAGTSTADAQTPGLPNTGTGGFHVQLAALTLLASAIILLLGRAVYRLIISG